jgi:hypothetical protein
LCRPSEKLKAEEYPMGISTHVEAPFLPRFLKKDAASFELCYEPIAAPWLPHFHKHLLTTAGQQQRLGDGVVTPS